MVVMVMMMVQSGYTTGRRGILVMVVVQAKHEAGRGGVPVMVARRGVQLSSPSGHGVQFTATAATDDTVTADDATAAAVTDIADNDAAATATTAAQRAQR